MNLIINILFYLLYTTVIFTSARCVNNTVVSVDRNGETKDYRKIFERYAENATEVLSSNKLLDIKTDAVLVPVAKNKATLINNKEKTTSTVESVFSINIETTLPANSESKGITKIDDFKSKLVDNKKSKGIEISTENDNVSDNVHLNNSIIVNKISKIKKIPQQYNLSNHPPLEQLIPVNVIYENTENEPISITTSKPQSASQDKDVDTERLNDTNHIKSSSDKIVKATLTTNLTNNSNYTSRHKSIYDTIDKSETATTADAAFIESINKTKELINEGTKAAPNVSPKDIIDISIRVPNKQNISLSVQKSDSTFVRDEQNKSLVSNNDTNVNNKNAAGKIIYVISPRNLKNDTDNSENNNKDKNNDKLQKEELNIKIADTVTNGNLNDVKSKNEIKVGVVNSQKNLLIDIGSLTNVSNNNINDIKIKGDLNKTKDVYNLSNINNSQINLKTSTYLKSDDMEKIAAENNYRSIPENKKDITNKDKVNTIESQDHVAEKNKNINFITKDDNGKLKNKSSLEETVTSVVSVSLEKKYDLKENAEQKSGGVEEVNSNFTTEINLDIKNKNITITNTARIPGEAQEINGNIVTETNSDVKSENITINNIPISNFTNVTGKLNNDNVDKEDKTINNFKHDTESDIKSKLINKSSLEESVTSVVSVSSENKHDLKENAKQKSGEVQEINGNFTTEINVGIKNKNITITNTEFKPEEAQEVNDNIVTETNSDVKIENITINNISISNFTSITGKLDNNNVDKEDKSINNFKDEKGSDVKSKTTFVDKYGKNKAIVNNNDTRVSNVNTSDKKIESISQKNLEIVNTADRESKHIAKSDNDHKNTMNSKLQEKDENKIESQFSVGEKVNNTDFLTKGGDDKLNNKLSLEENVKSTSSISQEKIKELKENTEREPETTQELNNNISTATNLDALHKSIIITETFLTNLKSNIDKSNKDIVSEGNNNSINNLKKSEAKSEDTPKLNENKNRTSSAKHSDISKTSPNPNKVEQDDSLSKEITTKSPEWSLNNRGIPKMITAEKTDKTNIGNSNNDNRKEQEIRNKHRIPQKSSSKTSELVTENRKSKYIRHRDPIVPIVESKNYLFSDLGKYEYSYEGADGTKAFEAGHLKQFEDKRAGEAVAGSYSYTDKSGNDFKITYTADENGYRPVGAHLPTPPPIPPAIARALAYLATKTTPEPVTQSL